MAGRSPQERSTARAAATSGNVHPSLVQPQETMKATRPSRSSECLSYFSQSAGCSSDHTHNLRRPATSKRALSPSATSGLRLASIWTAGLAQRLPGQKTRCPSSQDLLTDYISLDIQASDRLQFNICCQQHTHCASR